MLQPSLALLRRVPIWAWVLLALLAWGGFQRHQAKAVAAKFAAAQQQAAKEREAELARSLAVAAQRLNDQQENIRHANQATEHARADTASSAGAAERLRQRLAAEQARARAADSAAAAASAADRIAEAFGSCVAEYRSVAAIADAAIIAGQLCERDYDSLIQR